MCLFFAGIGKASFLRFFFENAKFISGITESEDLPGTLAHTDPDTMEQGFLTFMRLIYQCTSKSTRHHFLNQHPELCSIHWLEVNHHLTSTRGGSPASERASGTELTVMMSCFPQLKRFSSTGSVLVGYPLYGANLIQTSWLYLTLSTVGGKLKMESLSLSGILRRT